MEVASGGHIDLFPWFYNNTQYDFTMGFSLSFLAQSHFKELHFNYQNKFHLNYIIYFFLFWG